MRNPKQALRALVEPAPLTLGQIALLDLYKCPILDGKIDDLNATAFALWLLDMPIDRAVAEAHFPERAIAWLDEVGADGYNERLVKALEGIGAFFNVLPREENGEGGKKKRRSTGTGTSPCSPRRSAACTDGRSGTSSRKSRRSRQGCSTGCTPRGREG